MRWIALKLTVLVNFYLVSVPTEVQQDEEPTSANVREEIRQNLQAFVQADINGQEDELRKLLTDDVVWLPPSEQIVRGKENVLQYLEEHRAPGSLQVTPSRIDVDGDLAALRGTFALEVGGATVTGKMTQQWRRNDGQWRIASDIWNTDSPQPLHNASDSNDATRMADLESYMDGVIAGLMEAEHVAGVTVSIVSGNQVLLSKGYGLANVQDGLPVSADKTRFQIASITKLFTWTAVMQLVEQDKLDLHTDIQEYLPELTIPKTYADPITMAHLMSHTAGFEDRPVGLFDSQQMTLRDALQTNLPKRVRPPGHLFSYSNHGSAIAGLIVANVSGVTWEDYVQQNILAPLGMKETRTEQPYTEEIDANMSRGYRYSSGQYIAQPYTYCPIAPAAAITTTADDMTRFMRAHLNQGLFSGVHILQPPTVELMHSDLHRNHPLATPWAHGFHVHEQNSVRSIGHNGGMLHFFSNLRLYPTQDLGIFVAQNTAASTIVNHIADAFFDRYVAPVEHVAKSSGLSQVSPHPAVSGLYTRLTRNESGVTKISRILSPVRVRTSPAGTLWIGDREFQAISPLEFKSDRDAKAVFVLDEKGRPKNMFLDFVSFDRIPWYELPRFQLGLLTTCLITLASAVVGWPVLTFARWSLNAPALEPKGDHLALTFVAWSMGLVSILMVAFVAMNASSAGPFFRNEISAVRALVHASPLFGIGVLLSGFCTVRAWRNSAWLLRWRLHYSLVFAALFSLTCFFYHWNILQFWNPTI